jgi:hypothetical protein
MADPKSGLWVKASHGKNGTLLFGTSVAFSLPLELTPSCTHSRLFMAQEPVNVNFRRNQ